VLHCLARDAALADQGVPVSPESFASLNSPNGEGSAATTTDSPLVINDGRQNKLLLEEYDFTVLASGDVLSYVPSRLSAGSILQVGGNETIGKGLCAVRFTNETTPGKEETK
jgi:hypothetical protein